MKKTKEEILENCLNNIGFSFNEQLKPNNITIAEVKKTKKAFLKAMEEYAQQFQQDKPTELREELLKQIIHDLKNMNPYPKDVFIPITDEERKALNKLLKDNGYSPDGLHGNWGRYVWDLCVSKAEELIEEQLEESGNPANVCTTKDLTDSERKR